MGVGMGRVAGKRGEGKVVGMRRWCLWIMVWGWLGVGCGFGGNPAGIDRPTLVVLGDSLAAGYGVDPEEAYPARLQRAVEAAGLGYRVVNAGVSGDTTAGGLRRLNWVLRQPVEVLLVALGGNDGLRGLSPAMTRSNLVEIVTTARSRHPGLTVVLAGMQMPPNMGEDYVAAFREVYPWVAEQTGAVLVPHLLEGVGGRPEYNLPDLIHPNVEGHAMVASNVWSVLRPVLEERKSR